MELRFSILFGSKYERDDFKIFNNLLYVIVLING